MLTFKIYRDREHLQRDRNFSSIPNIHHQLTTRTIHMKRDQPPAQSNHAPNHNSKQSANSKNAINSTTASNEAVNNSGFGICVRGNKTLGKGVYIHRIEDYSPAAKAGLRVNDAILEINGQPFTSIAHEEAYRYSRLIEYNI